MCLSAFDPGIMVHDPIPELHLPTGCSTHDSAAYKASMDLCQHKTPWADGFHFPGKPTSRPYANRFKNMMA